MIYLHTGLPGAGKTILTLKMVRDRAEKENRAVYYAGIEILKPEMFPGWEPLPDPEKWFELPDGAIIVHDECQDLYRPRGTGAQVPKHVAQWETHRHKGYDAYLITQHPMLLDSNVRRLAGEHAHVVRPFGAKMATVHRWSSVKEQCDKSRADSVAVTMGYPGELFDAYKSATVHTHKFKLPGRIWFLAVIPLLLAACVWAFYSWYSGRAVPPSERLQMESGEGFVRASPSGSGGAVKSKSEWLDERAPRVAGLAHTAPVYDKVTTPTKAPYPAACMEMSGVCRCYSEQATRLDVPGAICRQIVAGGYYVEWDTERPDRRRDRDGGPTAPAAPLGS
jgi:hypothetical protein